jgi:hypothetical protein
MFQEPLLAVARPQPFFMRRRFVRSFLPVMFLAVTGLIVLLVSRIPLGLPFERLIVLEGVGGSGMEFLENTRVSEVLLRHHIRAQGEDVGSRAAANAKSPGDFVFVSGQPAADQVLKIHPNSKPYHPLVSPIALATFRDYAETLSANKIAEPRAVRTPFDRPYYYDLNMSNFLNLGNISWDKLEERTVPNNNAILGQFTGLCASNGADTYLGLVSFVKHGRVPINEQEAIDFANDIKPLLRSQGLPFRIPQWKYFSELGPQVAPIVVMYEHQWLAGQVDHIKRFHALYDDRVVLYPNPQFTTEPAFIALNAKQLGDLLETNPDLRMRALELGFRVLTRPGSDPGESLSTFLSKQGVPVPPTPANTM